MRGRKTVPQWSASTPTPQQLNGIIAQLRDLNTAYMAAVAANANTEDPHEPGRPIVGKECRPR
jgi:hypothetical protein